MEEDARKLLVYGGAFNPPHLGHLRYFESAVGVVKPDIAMILPSGVSPHKKNGTTPFAHRAAMCRIFKKVEGAKVVVSGIENLKKPCRSYTIKSLRRLRRRYKGYDIYFMIGSDMLLSFKSWHLWRRILAMCTLVVGVRDDDHSEASAKAAEDLRKLGARIIMVPFEPIEVSSSQVRRRASKCEGCADLVGEENDAYIKKHSLYKGMYKES